MDVRVDSTERARPADEDPSLWCARIHGVSQSYGKAIALDDVTLDIPSQKMIGLIGPDGVGKSTFSKIDRVG